MALWGKSGRKTLSWGERWYLDHGDGYVEEEHNCVRNLAGAGGHVRIW